jgi:hypothetical protein
MKCLVTADREHVSNLRTDAENARAKAPKNSRLTEVIGDLLVAYLQPSSFLSDHG